MDVCRIVVIESGLLDAYDARTVLCAIRPEAFFILYRWCKINIVHYCATPNLFSKWRFQGVLHASPAIGSLCK